MPNGKHWILQREHMFQFMQRIGLDTSIGRSEATEELLENIYQAWKHAFVVEFDWHPRKMADWEHWALDQLNTNGDFDGPEESKRLLREAVRLAMIHNLLGEV